MDQLAGKELVGKELAARAKDGDVLGVGTGSTVDAALAAIGERVKREGLHLHVVPTSFESAWRCQELGLNVLYPGFRGDLSWGFDGADEVDPQLRLIKGKGGALLKEKILAARCLHYIIIVDESKIVKKLGERCPVPVEVVPEALSIVERELRQLGASEVVLRIAVKKHGPVITEAGNILLDVRFPSIDDTLEQKIKSIVGVVESGIFSGYTDEVLVATVTEGIRTLTRNTRA